MTPRRRVWLLAPFLVLCLLLLTHPGRVAVKSVLLLPEVFSQIPVRPLTWVTPQPRVETFGFDYSAGRVEGDLYLPGAAGRYGALILILGARPVANDAPILVRFAEGLARSGMVVMVPASSNLTEGLVLPEEVDAIVREVALLRGRDEVDPTRVGILGLSVGASLAVLAATDPRLDGQLAFVNAFGGYNDARDLVRAVAARSLAYAGVDEPWEPASLTIWVMARQLVEGLPEGTDRDILDRLFVQHDPAARKELERLSPVGRAIVGLLEGLPPTEVEPALALLPPSVHERLRLISPGPAIERLRTTLFVMHDLDDHYIPYTESRRLVAGAPDGAVRLYTEFELFSHVVPDRPPSSPAVLIELAKLYRQIFQTLLYLL